MPGAAPLRGAIIGAALGAVVGLAGAYALVIGPQRWLDAGLSWLALDAAAAWGTRATLLGAGAGAALCLAECASTGRGIKRLAAFAAIIAAAAWWLHAGLGLSQYAAQTSATDLLVHAGAIALALFAGFVLARRERPGTILLLLPSVLVLGGSAALPALRPPPTGPNLLLISVDTLRADRLGCYGHADARTPRIDALARGGTLYETVIASAPVTLTATSTLLTGLDPTDHGAHYNGYYRLRPDATTLAEVLAERGYVTGAVIGNFALSARFGTDQGFAHFDDRMTQILQPDRRPAPHADRDDETWWTRHLRSQPAQRFADEVTDAGAAWLAQRDARPWFLWVHYMDPHSPYAPPAQYAPLAAGGSAYDGEVAFVDHEIGRLLDEHNRRFPERDTVVVLVADHGENLGEHDYIGHVRSVDEPSLRVPFIVHDMRAELAPDTAGRRESAPLRGRDVGGVVLEALGVSDGPPALRRAPPPGPSWWAYSQTYASRFLDGQAPTRVLREARFKYIDRPGDEDALFDLDADPGEDHDVSEEHTERLAGMRARLAEATGDVSDTPEIVDDATRRVLEQLGYVGDH